MWFILKIKNPLPCNQITEDPNALKPHEREIEKETMFFFRQGLDVGSGSV